LDTELAFSRAPDAAASSSDADGVSPNEAARRLGVSRSRIYALVEQGQLDEVGDVHGGLRISITSIQRRLTAAPPVGQPLSSSSAWAVLALGSGDAAFRAFVAARLSDPDRSRAKARLSQHSLLELLPRLSGRNSIRRFAVDAEALVDLRADARVILAGASAAHALGWDLAPGNRPAEAYVSEVVLVDLVEQYQLDPDASGDLVLRSVPQPWPFPPHLRVVPELVAAVDLADGLAVELAEFGRARLLEVASLTSEVSWQQRPQRRRTARPLIPSRPPGASGPRRLQLLTGDALWDDRAERDARGLVALLFVAGRGLRRAELAEALHCSIARVDRARDFLRASPPHGLVLLELADELKLVTAPDVGKLVETFINVSPAEPLSQAALEVLAIVAYEQPVSRSDIAHIRAIDSTGVVDTLLARGLIADDARYGGRGRPAFLVTTDRFLQVMGIGSLAELPSRQGTP
jgi:segregation and condensation protein B